MFILIDRNPYQNFFQLTMKCLQGNGCHRTADAICTYHVLQVKLYLLKFDRVKVRDKAEMETFVDANIADSVCRFYLNCLMYTLSFFLEINFL